MKLICGLVRPDRLEAVKLALEKVHAQAITVAEVHDYAPQKHESAVWRAREYTLGFSIKVEIQVVVHDGDVDAVIDAIIRTARTGVAGDGYVSVAPLEHRYSIRTGDRDV